MSNKLTEKDICDLKDAFAIVDKNNDGFINKSHVKDILISIGLDGSNDQVHKVIVEMDADGDGKINFPEFLNMMAKNIYDGTASFADPLEHMFRIIDRDNDGFITHTEMKRALDEMEGAPVHDSEVDGMMKEADQDGDDKISFEEFVAQMKKTHPKQYCNS